MLLVVTWMLLGSLYMNYLYAKEHKENFKRMQFWGVAQHFRIENGDYIRGALFGLILGPLSPIIKYYTKRNEL